MSTPLYNKIIQLCPNLTEADFTPGVGTILLRDDSNGKGPYIKEWMNTQYTQPTQAQLDAIP